MTRKENNMSERYELAKAVLGQDTDELIKQHSMQELSALFCRIVKAPTAPKFSDKKAAVKRIKQMAEEVVKAADPVPVPELNAIFTEPTKKKAGRPRNKPREYLFQEAEDKAPRLAAQAYAIIDHLLEWSNGEWLSEDQVRHFVIEASLNGDLTTKQSPWRIFQYYRAQMISRGFLRMRNVNEG